MTTQTTNWAAFAREHRKRDRLEEDACQLCGEDDLRCLRQVVLQVPTEGTITTTLCAGCHVQLQGKRPTERHHPAGRANDPVTVAIPANDHAILTDRQHDWPVDTWRNPDGSPLLKAAACLRGWLDVLRELLERTVGWIPAFLERLDEVLRQHVGPRWWEMLAMEGATP